MNNKGKRVEKINNSFIGHTSQEYSKNRVSSRLLNQYSPVPRARSSTAGKDAT